MEGEIHPVSVGCSLRPPAPDGQALKCILTRAELQYKSGQRSLQWVEQIGNHEPNRFCLTRSLPRLCSLYIGPAEFQLSETAVREKRLQKDLGRFFPSHLPQKGPPSKQQEVLKISLNPVSEMLRLTTPRSGQGAVSHQLTFCSAAEQSAIRKKKNGKNGF